jgi:alkanesulfonate monooxygenase SsuD/methylene tetrahydromethanopterin reductase-like flavin-dependent oxidoreductase (luciferase family)
MPSGVTVVGYHASHEQHPPSALLTAAGAAADAGFGAVSSSDHVAPWSREQGESGFARSWLGAAMEAVPVPFGVANAPGQLYHPVIVAQAIATLTEMHPDPLGLALGSGEASNEHSRSRASCTIGYLRLPSSSTSRASSPPRRRNSGGCGPGISDSFPRLSRKR